MRSFIIQQLANAIAISRPPSSPPTIVEAKEEVIGGARGVWCQWPKSPNYQYTNNRLQKETPQRRRRLCLGYFWVVRVCPRLLEVLLLL